MTESNRYQQGSLTLVKNKTKAHTWFFRYYEVVASRRVYRRIRVGTVHQYPKRSDAQKAVLSLRATINSQVHTPQTVTELAQSYEKRELSSGRKTYSTIQNHLSLTKLYILPKWGGYLLSEVRTAHVEEWLHALPLAPASQRKVKSVFSVLYSHAIWSEWVTSNPITKVRASSSPLREKDVLSPSEFQTLLSELSVRDKAMVFLAGSTGLRRSELVALT